jgi:hypothetical protein
MTQPEPPQYDEHATDRVAMIAWLHSMARWLADNPDIPTPYELKLIASAGPNDRTSDGYRLAIIDRFAEAYDADRFGLGDGACHQYAQLQPKTARDRVHVSYTVSTTVAPKPKCSVCDEAPCGCVCLTGG